VQAYGSKRLDASLLLIPLVGFLPATDPRVRGTLRAIEDKLLVDDEFILLDPSDGLPPGEGAPRPEGPGKVCARRDPGTPQLAQ
jgi:hypothetical protein